MRPLLVGSIGAVLLLAGVAYGFYRYIFPYGWSHACSAALGISAYQYALDHDGWFPHGKATPEASLGLLLVDDSSLISVIAGKQYEPKMVEAALATNGEVGPGSCGWHYVEGLRKDDDPQIAIAWDKVTGLGHNGERRGRGIREVVLAEGSNTFVAGTNWLAFIEEQKRLLAAAAAKRKNDWLTNAPPIRWSDEASLGPNTAKPQISK